MMSSITVRTAAMRLLGEKAPDTHNHLRELGQRSLHHLPCSERAGGLHCEHRLLQRLGTRR